MHLNGFIVQILVDPNDIDHIKPFMIDFKLPVQFDGHFDEITDILKYISNKCFPM